MRLPLRWLEAASPPPGKVLIERDEEVYLSGGLVWIPPNAASRKRPPHATIVHAGDGPWFKKGDRVMVSALVGKKYTFGEGKQERVIYACSPRTILALMDEEAHLSGGDEAATGRFPYRAPIADLAHSGAAEHGRGRG